MNVKVTRPRVQIRLNGKLVSDYIEPANPVLPSPGPKLNLLGKGTFALQCHDEDSRARFRNIRVRRLPPGEDPTVTKPVLSEQDLRRLALGKDNFPIVNLRINAGGKLSTETLEKLRTQTGIFPGIVYSLASDQEVRNDAAALTTVAALKDQPAFIGLDVSSAMIMDQLPGTPPVVGETRAKFDFLVARPTLAGVGGEFFETTTGRVNEEIMKSVVEHVVQTIETQPIDVYADVMVLPQGLPGLADELWTEERMQRVIAAAAQHDVAFEINLRERTPSEKFIKLAKAAKVKFTFGSDDIRADNYGDWSYALEMQKACGLTWKDMWVPGHQPTRAQRELAKK